MEKSNNNKMYDGFFKNEKNNKCKHNIRKIMNK